MGMKMITRLVGETDQEWRKRAGLTSREMQKLSAQKRWGKMTPEQRSAIMSRVRAGGKIFMSSRELEFLSENPMLTPSRALGGKRQSN
jgi:hypothetical protein